MMVVGDVMAMDETKAIDARMRDACSRDKKKRSERALSKILRAALPLMKVRGLDCPQPSRLAA